MWPCCLLRRCLVRVFARHLGPSTPSVAGHSHSGDRKGNEAAENTAYERALCRLPAVTSPASEGPFGPRVPGHVKLCADCLSLKAVHLDVNSGLILLFLEA